MRASSAVGRLPLCLAVAAAALLLARFSLADGPRIKPQPQPVEGRSLDELLLFFPTRFPAGDWEPEGLRFEEVYFTANDGTKLHGWYCPADRPRGVLLVAHGNAGHVASRAAMLRYFQSELHVSTFTFDYRGYGRSEGVPTVRGVLQDARAARAKLRELAGIEDFEMLILGESLGGAVAVQMAAESPPRGLILQSTFSSLRDVADVHYPALSWLVPRDKLDSASAIAGYQGPLLQSHGTADRTIPIASGEKLFRSAAGPKMLVRVPGAGHNNAISSDYLQRLDQFIGKLEK